MTIIPTVDELTEPTVMRNMRKLAQGVDKNFNEMQTSVDNAVETANNAMEATEGFDDRITDNATAIQNEETARQNADEAEADARAKADITGIVTAIASGAINVTLNRELGNLSDSVTGPFIKTATLIPSATDRAFKLQFQYWDDTTYTTNDFVIPEGGGTDVSVSGVTVSEGDNNNEFKVSIQLDDATTIDSNSYPFPEAVTNPYPTSATLALSGNTLNLTIGLSNSTNVSGSVDLSPILANYVTDTELTEQISDIQEQITGLKLSKPAQNQIQLNGDNVNVIEGITGEVVDGKLKLTINGFAGSDIPLPKSDILYNDLITTSGGYSKNISFNTELNFVSTNIQELFAYIDTSVYGQIFCNNMLYGIVYNNHPYIVHNAVENSRYESYGIDTSNANMYKVNGTGIITINESVDVSSKLNIPNGNYKLFVPDIRISGSSNRLYSNNFEIDCNVNNNIITINTSVDLSTLNLYCKNTINTTTSNAFTIISMQYLYKVN